MNGTIEICALKHRCPIKKPVMTETVTSSGVPMIITNNLMLRWNSTNQSSHVTIFKLCDWSNSSVENYFTLYFVYRIGSSALSY